MQVHQTFKDFEGEEKTFVCNALHSQFAVSVADGEQNMLIKNGFELNGDDRHDDAVFIIH